MTGRIAKLIAVLAAAGLTGWLLAKGVRGGVSFGAGAAVSALSFWWLSRMVAGIEKAALGGRISGGRTALNAARIFLLGGSLYVIVRVYEVFVPALVTGLLVTVVAITLEALYEFIYASNA